MGDEHEENIMLIAELCKRDFTNDPPEFTCPHREVKERDLIPGTGQFFYCDWRAWAPKLNRICFFTCKKFEPKSL